MEVRELARLAIVRITLEEPGVPGRPAVQHGHAFASGEMPELRRSEGGLVGRCC